MSRDEQATTSGVTDATPADITGHGWKLISGKNQKGNGGY